MVDRKLGSCLTAASSSTIYAITAIRVGSLGCNRSYSVTLFTRHLVALLGLLFERSAYLQVVYPLPGATPV
jgi:hypothetical protein